MKNQRILRILLFVNTLMESGFGIFLLIRPDKFTEVLGSQPAGEGAVLISRMYGLAALLMGVLSLGLLVRKQASDFLPTGLLILSLFHIGLFFIQLVDNPNWLIAGYLHAVLGPAFLFFFLQNTMKSKA